MPANFYEGCMIVKKSFSVVLIVLMAIIALTAVPSANAAVIDNSRSVHTNQSADLGIPPLDFGDSNDYDIGGGSDWGGSSDWDYDSDWGDSDYSSSGSSRGSGGSLGWPGITVVAVIVIIIVIYGMVKGKKNGGTTTTTTTPGRSQTIQQAAGRNVILPDRTAQISDLIKRNDPNFSAEDFLSFSRFVYVTIQDAWSNRDLSPVRIYLHDNLYNQTQKQVERKIANGVINKIENVAVSTAYLTAYRRDKEFEYVTVYLNARLTDYEINEKTGQVLRGDPNARYELRYALRFARNSSIKTTSANSKTLKSHSCPNCGAPLEMSSSGKCEYCGSTITTGQYSWVLSEYSSIRNDTVDQGIYIEKDNNAQNNMPNNNNTPNNNNQ